MNEEIKYWKWKSTIIDFNTISDETLDYAFNPKKKDWVFRYLGIPDNEIHEWYNGGFSSEYNWALKYAKELDLIEDYIDYEEIICDLKEQLEQKEDIINKIREYLTSYESISEFEGLNNVKENKKLDEKTMNEMIRRYMNIHDKILEILDNKGE